MDTQKESVGGWPRSRHGSKITERYVQIKIDCYRVDGGCLRMRLKPSSSKSSKTLCTPCVFVREFNDSGVSECTYFLTISTIQAADLNKQ